jgi:hypothetical protein
MSCSHHSFFKMASEQRSEPPHCPDCGATKLDVRLGEERRSRRDTAAISALQGFLSSGGAARGAAGCARLAVEFADALIAELDGEASS